MGAFGYKIQENDTYLDELGDMIDLVTKKALKVASIKNWDENDELDFVSFVEILCLLTKNQICKVESASAAIILERLENLIKDKELLSSWKIPQKRKKELQKLLKRFVSTNDLE